MSIKSFFKHFTIWEDEVQDKALDEKTRLERNDAIPQRFCDSLAEYIHHSHVTKRFSDDRIENLRRIETMIKDSCDDLIYQYIGKSQEEKND